MGIGEVGEKLRRSTVVVTNGAKNGSPRGRQAGAGSGIVWDASGLIVTNAHVIDSADITIELWDGHSTRAVLDRRDLGRDLAILRVDSARLEPARHLDSRRIRVGELVIAVGNPLGFVGALSTGVVYGFGPADIGSRRGSSGREFIQTTARLAPGNSGGPLADAEGNVIGVNAAVASGGLGLAVPASAVRRLLADGPPAELGVTLRPVRIPGPGGGIALLVLSTAVGGPADYASLRIGDVLTGVNGKRFTSVDDLRESLDRTRGALLTLQFIRGGDGRRREVTVRLRQDIAA
jgi:serine protease Do